MFLWSLTHQQKLKTRVWSTTWNDERLIWNCSWNKVAEGSIVFPACHLWFSISRKCWSLELENSGAPGRTLAPPHRDQSAGRAQFSVWKPSQRSKSHTDKRQTSVIFIFIAEMNKQHMLFAYNSVGCCEYTSPDHWFQWQYGQPSPDASLWSGFSYH